MNIVSNNAITHESIIKNDILKPITESDFFFYTVLYFILILVSFNEIKNATSFKNNNNNLIDDTMKKSSNSNFEENDNLSITSDLTNSVLAKKFF